MVSSLGREHVLGLRFEGDFILDSVSTVVRGVTRLQQLSLGYVAEIALQSSDVLDRHTCITFSITCRYIYN